MLISYNQHHILRNIKRAQCVRHLINIPILVSTFIRLFFLGFGVIIVCLSDYTRTLPNPKRQHNRNGLNDQNRAKDDHMLVPNGLYVPSPSPASSLIIKGGNYISSPSPAPPPDGSYFNMSDKYISYPPVVSR